MKGRHTGSNNPMYGRKGKDAGNWKGGWKKTTDGYIAVYAPDHPFKNKKGYVLEHRLVMEKKIGRYLKPEEVVHHINGNRMNNKVTNLQLFPNNGEHTKDHIRVRDTLGRFQKAA